MAHWQTKNETMRRVRHRIGAVMKLAVAQRYRDDNPAGDAISAALPKTGAVRKHQRALPFAEVGEALDKVRASGAFASTVLALEFLVLTACRSSEIRLATWDEVDLETGTWTVPAGRMKAKRDHRVPLPARALEIVHAARELSEDSDLVFPSAHGRALSDNTISSCSGTSASRPCRTASVPSSGTGRPSAPMRLARSGSSRWHI